ncbi:MAG: hypothetical protein ABI613_04425 [Gemmatimonadota bacterium]
MIGSFSDDYGIGYQISDTLWQLGNRDRYHIAAWNDSAGYLVAQNDPGNVADGGKWTRIDWLLLDGMPPYEWAFCLTEYKADTKAQAEANRTADRPNPRKGCNGFPFSRMRRVPADSAFTKVYQ